MEWSHHRQLFRSRGITCPGHTGAHNISPGQVSSSRTQVTRWKAISQVCTREGCNRGGNLRSHATRKHHSHGPIPAHTPLLTPELMSLHMLLYAPLYTPLHMPIYIPLSSSLPCPGLHPCKCVSLQGAGLWPKRIWGVFLRWPVDWPNHHLRVS